MDFKPTHEEEEKEVDRAVLNVSDKLKLLHRFFLGIIPLHYPPAAVNTGP